MKVEKQNPLEGNLGFLRFGFANRKAVCVGRNFKIKLKG